LISHGDACRAALAVDAIGNWQGLDGWACSCALQHAGVVTAGASQRAVLGGSAVGDRQARIDLGCTLVQAARALLLADSLGAIDVCGLELLLDHGEALANGLTRPDADTLDLITACLNSCAVTTEEAAHHAAVRGTSVLVLQGARDLRAESALWHVSWAVTVGVARGRADLAATLEITGHLVIHARRSTIVGGASRSWCRSGCRRCWRGWCRRRSRGSTHGGVGRLIGDAALAEVNVDISVDTPR